MINNSNFSISIFEDNAGNLYLSAVDDYDNWWIGFYTNAIDCEPCYLRAAEDYDRILRGADPFSEGWGTEFVPDAPIEGIEIFYHFAGYEPVTFAERAGHSGRHFMAEVIHTISVVSVAAFHGNDCFAHTRREFETVAGAAIFYVQLQEMQSDNGAFRVLIDWDDGFYTLSGWVSLEYLIGARPTREEVYWDMDKCIEFFG